MPGFADASLRGFADAWLPGPADGCAEDFADAVGAGAGTGGVPGVDSAAGSDPDTGAEGVRFAVLTECADRSNWPAISPMITAIAARSPPEPRPFHKAVNYFPFPVMRP